MPVTLHNIAGADAPPNAGQAAGANEASFKFMVYRISHVPVQDLGIAISQMLRSTQARIAPEAISNSLLISATPEVHQEIQQAIAVLDRPAPRVSIDAEIVHVAWFDPGKAVADSPPGTRAEALVDLSANPKELVARLRLLEQKGLVEVLNRLSLSALSNQTAHITVGDRRQVTRSSTGGRVSQPTGTRSPDASGFPGWERGVSTLENTGTILGVTPRVGHDGTIALKIDLEKSYLSPRPDDASASAILTATLQSTISLRDGETVVLGGFSSSTKPGQSQLVMLVTARIAAR